jgi:hypothetical protein
MMKAQGRKKANEQGTKVKCVSMSDSEHALERCSAAEDGWSLAGRRKAHRRWSWRSWKKVEGQESREAELHDGKSGGQMRMAMMTLMTMMVASGRQGPVQLMCCG